MVPGAGIEPARLAAGDFESPASTNFTTRARERRAILWHRFFIVRACSEKTCIMVVLWCCGLGAGIVWAAIGQYKAVWGACLSVVSARVGQA